MGRVYWRSFQYENTSLCGFDENKSEEKEDHCHFARAEIKYLTHTYIFSFSASLLFVTRQLTCVYSYLNSLIGQCLESVQLAVRVVSGRWCREGRVVRVASGRCREGGVVRVVPGRSCREGGVVRAMVAERTTIMSKMRLKTCLKTPIGISKFHLNTVLVTIPSFIVEAHLR